MESEWLFRWKGEKIDKMDAFIEEAEWILLEREFPSLNEGNALGFDMERRGRSMVGAEVSTTTVGGRCSWEMGVISIPTEFGGWVGSFTWLGRGSEWNELAFFGWWCSLSLSSRWFADFKWISNVSLLLLSYTWASMDIYIQWVNGVVLDKEARDEESTEDDDIHGCLSMRTHQIVLYIQC